MFYNCSARAEQIFAKLIIAPRKPRTPACR